MKTKSLKILQGLKISFLIILCSQLTLTFVLAGWPTNASAATEGAAPLQFEPQIRIPESVFNAQSVTVATFDTKTGRMNSDLLAKYIQAIYNYGMAIVGILAAIVLMGGGVLWLTSGGDSSKISQAKELIFGSIIGTGILFGSWIILNTVNPDLLKLKNIETIALSKATIYDAVCCDATVGGEIIKLTKKDGKRVFTADPTKEFTTCADANSKFSANTKECPSADYSCEMSGDNPYGVADNHAYKCVDTNDVCCACAVGLFGSSLSTKCDNHLTASACKDFCATSGSYTMVLLPGEYTCGNMGLYAWCAAPAK